MTLDGIFRRSRAMYFCLEYTTRALCDWSSRFGAPVYSGVLTGGFCSTLWCGSGYFPIARTCTSVEYRKRVYTSYDFQWIIVDPRFEPYLQSVWLRNNIFKKLFVPNKA